MTLHKKDIPSVHNVLRNTSCREPLESWMVVPSDITEFGKWINRRLRIISMESSSTLQLVSDILSNKATLYYNQQKCVTNEPWNLKLTLLNWRVFELCLKPWGTTVIQRAILWALHGYRPVKKSSRKLVKFFAKNLQCNDNAFYRQIVYHQSYLCLSFQWVTCFRLYSRGNKNHESKMREWIILRIDKYCTHPMWL